jgi:hypothetical protein
MSRRPGGRGPGHRHFDDAGGVWILTGIVLGVLLYAGIVLMYVAGFTTVAPLVVIPPVLIGLIGANSLLGGGRGHGQSGGRPAGKGQAPRPSGEPIDPLESGTTLPTRGGPAGEEPRAPT